MNTWFRIGLAVGMLSALTLAASKVASEVSEVSGSASEASGAETLVAKLKSLRPDLPISQVHESPMPGIYALELSDGRTVLYGTADGRYLFAGDLYELDNELVNVTETLRANRRKDLIDSFPEEEMVVFGPDEPKHAVYVFTDVDCTYCRKLHAEMDQINALGIEVRYLAYPRSGIGSDSYNKIVSAWCADDPQSALTAVKAGQVIPAKTCANPVSDHYSLGQQVGISGTPAILTEDGRLYPGYMPAAQLAAVIAGAE